MLVRLITLILNVALIVFCSEDEERLVRDLFRDYNKLIHPVKFINQTVIIDVKLSFIQLININEKSQIMTSNVWVQLQWNDYQLTWDPADYGGIGVLRLPPDKVWRPDLVLFNNADGNYEVRFKSNALLYSNGLIFWLPPAIYQSTCQIDVTYFPFDQQRCVMKFGSWTYNGDQVSLALYQNKSHVDLSDYWQSGTWDIIDVPATLNVYKNVKSGKTDTDISFFITIRRKTLFYTVNLILPTVLISFLCILVFYLPSEAGEKVTLGISILLSLVVFLLLVSKILPPTSLVLPLIAKYLLFTFLMNCISILATVVVINWNFRGPRTHKMPDWVRIVFLKYLPALLFMKRPKKTRLRWMMDMPNLHHDYHHHHHPPPPHHSQSPPPPTNVFGQQQLQHHIPSSHHSYLQMQDSAPSYVPTTHGEIMSNETSPTVGRTQHLANCIGAQHPSGAIPPHIDRGPDMTTIRDSDSLDLYFMSPDAYRAAEAIDFIAEHLRNEDQYIQIREDWKYVAMVIDRLQLYLFFGITSFGTIAILLDAPHIFQPINQDEVIAVNRHQ